MLRKARNVAKTNSFNEPFLHVTYTNRDSASSFPDVTSTIFHARLVCKCYSKNNGYMVWDLLAEFSMVR
jgi:hypothetical protein